MSFGANFFHSEYCDVKGTQMLDGKTSKYDKHSIWDANELAVEHVVFRDTSPFCMHHDRDKSMCLTHYGHRKIFANPLKVTLCLLIKFRENYHLLRENTEEVHVEDHMHLCTLLVALVGLNLPTMLAPTFFTFEESLILRGIIIRPFTPSTTSSPFPSVAISICS